MKGNINIQSKNKGLLNDYNVKENDKDGRTTNQRK